MALDPNYIVGINLGEVFVDNTTGLALSGGKLYFYEDSARSVPKTVYQLTGSPPNYTYSPLPNPIILSAVGKIVNNSGTNVPVYYKPYDSQGRIQNYYVYSESSDGTFQQEWQAWPNVTPTSSPSGESSSTTQNQISNSQFVDVTFPTDTGLMLSWTGALSETTYEIAPDWDLVIEASGTGSVEINRTAIAGSLNVITNPPFALDIIASSVNITTLKLVQRLSNNPDIWANQYVAGNMVVESLDGISRTFSMNYAPSISVAATEIFEGASGAGDPTQLFGSVLIPSGTNSENGDVGYVDIEIILPNAGHYSLTSIQVTSSDAEPDATAASQYQEQPSNRQKDFSFHHYRPQILQLAVPSISQGWDFRVNPAQWGASGSLAAVRSQYAWDQTILYQSIDSAISYQRASDMSLQVDIGSTCQFALIQYLDPPMFQQLLQSNFSALLTALTDVSGGVTGTVSFWYTTDASLPNVAAGTNQSVVATLDADGKPATFNGTWAEIERSTGWDARFTIPEGTTEYTSVPLEGWNASTLTVAGTATYVAIVVGFSSTTAGAVNFQSISVTPTLIASPFAPLSYELTLNQLQRLYEKSYGETDYPGTATGRNAIMHFNEVSNPSGATINVLPDSIFLEYKVLKRKIPSVTIYGGSVSSSNVFGIIVINYLDGTVSDISTAPLSDFFGSASLNSTKNYYIAPANANTIHSYSGSPGDVPRAFFQFHYTADARLGIV